MMFTGGFETETSISRRPPRPHSAMERGQGRQPPAVLTPVKEGGLRRPQSAAVVRESKQHVGFTQSYDDAGYGGKSNGAKVTQSTTKIASRPRSAATQRLDGITEGNEDKSPTRGGILRSGVRPKSAINQRYKGEETSAQGGALRPQSAAYLRGVTAANKHPLASAEGHNTTFGRMQRGSGGLDLSGLESEAESRLGSDRGSVLGSSKGSQHSRLSGFDGN